MLVRAISYSYLLYRKYMYNNVQLHLIVEELQFKDYSIKDKSVDKKLAKLHELLNVDILDRLV